MSDKSTSKKVMSGFIWKFLERIGAQLVTFVVSIVLARLMAPKEFGAIAMVNVFITIANVFVTSGLGVALIQKKDSDSLDFSSVFYTNVLLSIVLYGILFFAAPVISGFYNMPVLTAVFRVLGLRIIVAAINSIQHAYVSRHMLFKCFFYSTLGGTVVSGIVGIILAYMGCGIWALVAQYMVNTTVDTLVLFFTVKWKPTIEFSFSRLKGLVSYGWKMLFSELINTGYIELRSLIVGKKYSPSDLAHYTKGQSFPKLIVVNINASIQSVMFPALANAQENIPQVKEMTRKSIRVNSFVMLPLIIGMALVGKPMISLLLTDKWLPCVPYLQLYCLFYCFMPIQAANLQAIKAIGRSDVYLKLEIVKKIVGIVALLIAMPFGTLWIAISAVASNIFSALINAVPNRHLLNYKFRELIADYCNGIIPLLFMSVVVVLVGFLPVSNLLQIALQVISGAVVYLLVSWLFKCDSLIYFWGVLKNMLNRKKKS